MAATLDTRSRRRLVAALLALDATLPGALLSWRRLADLLGVSHPTLADDRKRPDVLAESAALAGAGLRLAVLGAYRAGLLRLARLAADNDAHALGLLGVELARLDLAGAVLAPDPAADGIDDADALAAVGMGPGDVFAGDDAGAVLAGLLAGMAAEPGSSDRCADGGGPSGDASDGASGAPDAEASESGQAAGGTPAGGAAASGMGKPHSDCI